MNNTRRLWLGLVTVGVITPLPVQADVFYERSGRVGVEVRAFTQQALYDQQQDAAALSLVLEPQFYWEWNDGDDSVRITPYARFDQQDEERHHRDIRELSWIHVMDNYELRSGIRKVFWGKTEFVHLVDVINQTDLVEDIDGEDKLGQPMINLSNVNDWGIVDLFVLPFFRERTFAGTDGRLRPALAVDGDAAQYQSADEQRHIDYAVRWSQSVDVFDLGIHWFRGTNRDPVLQGRMVNGVASLIPYYEQMTQAGMDAQATINSWLWKLEGRYRRADSGDYWATQGGFEYTLYGIRDSSTDLGLLLEYGWDERAEEANSISQNDLYTGGRLAFNDEADSQMLAGVGYDLDYGSVSLMAEASQRLGSQWKLGAEVRVFVVEDQQDVLYLYRQDDHVQLTAEYYY